MVSNALKRSRESAEALLKRYRESGQTQKAFCEAEGLSLSTFTFWLGRERKQQGKATKERFVRIKTAKGNSRAEISIVLPDGTRLDCSDATSAEHVADLVAALRSRMQK